MSIEYNSHVPAFLETKPNQFLKTEKKKSDCTLKRSSSFEDKSYACRLHHHSVPHGLGVWVIN